MCAWEVYSAHFLHLDAIKSFAPSGLNLELVEQKAVEAPVGRPQLDQVGELDAQSTLSPVFRAATGRVESVRTRAHQVTGLVRTTGPENGLLGFHGNSVLLNFDIVFLATLFEMVVCA